MKLAIMWMRVFNSAAILSLTAIIAMASLLQYHLHELPCALCIMQRFGVLAITYGFLLNLAYGFKPSHYALVIFSALFTGAIAACQELLHILPGSSVFALPLWGLGLYTWVCLLCLGIILFCSGALLINQQFHQVIPRSKIWSNLTVLLFSLALLLIALNIMNTYMICGFAKCPSNPTHYLGTKH